MSDPCNEAGRLAEFLSQRKACRSFFVVAMVLEFRYLRLTRLLRSGSLEGRGVEIWKGYFSTIGVRILNSEAEVCTLGLGHLSEVVFQRRLLGGSFAGMGQGGSYWGVRSLDMLELWQT